MDLYQAIQNRYSCRSYKTDPLQKNLIEKLIGIAHQAPSAGNLQPWQFIAVTHADTRKLLSKAYPKEWFWKAPAIIVACGDPSKGWQRKWDGQGYTWVDVAIAFDHLILSATAEGLATCWIGAFKEDVIKKVLSIPEGIRIVAMTPLGYPADTKVVTPRKTLNQVLMWEKWG